MFRLYKFRAYLTHRQERLAGKWLGLTREVYNAALQERRDAWAMCRKVIFREDQQNQLPDAKRLRPDLAEVPAKVLQNTLGRLDKAFAAFFRRCKSGEAPGYPRFKNARRWSSLSFDYQAAHLDGAHVRLAKLGRVKLRAYRELPTGAVLKVATLKREADGWYVILCCEVPQPAPLPPTGRSVGIDVGLASLIATSDGELVENPKWLERSRLKLERAQRRASRRKRGSKRRAKAVNQLARLHQLVARQRKHHLDTLTRRLVDENDVIALEDLSPGLIRAGGKNAQGRGLRRSMLDAAWGQLRHMLAYKAEEAGRRVVLVDPRGTSQECSACGQLPLFKKTLSDRVHECKHKNGRLQIDRDVNAGRNILKRALSVLRREAPVVMGPQRPAKARC